MQPDPFTADYPEDVPLDSQSRKKLGQPSNTMKEAASKLRRFLYAGLNYEERQNAPRIKELFNARELEDAKRIPDVGVQLQVYRSLILQSCRLDPNMRVSASNTHKRRGFLPLFSALYEAHEELRQDWVDGYLDDDENSGNRPERISKSSIIEKALNEILCPDLEFEAGLEAVRLAENGLPFSVPESFSDEDQRNAWIIKQRRKLAEEAHWFGTWTIEQLIGVDPPPDSGSGE